jgi:hypothetical protein
MAEFPLGAGRYRIGVTARLSALMAALLALALMIGAVSLPANAEPPPSPEESAGRANLAKLVVAEAHSMEGYSRTRFRHWVKKFGTCDTREVVLMRDGEGVDTDDQCRTVAGSWYSVYDDQVMDSASRVDIDHMVPLANGWRSGADLWDDARRMEFANDLEHAQLLAVSARSNRSKADKGPEFWKPPYQDYWCTYALHWIDVKFVWSLAVTAAEQGALNEMLDTCTDEEVPPPEPEPPTP